MATSALPPRQRLLDALDQLAGTRAVEARLVLQAGPVYLIWTARGSGGLIEHESVSSTALPASHKLSSARGMLLREFGFAKRSGRRNWKREHGRDRASLERSADETLDILTRVYGVHGPDQPEPPFGLALSEDRTEHPLNPDLIAAMREVAKRRDDPSRRAMYSEMLNATFLVPIDAELDDDVEGSDAFHAFEKHESGRPTLGVFTDWASLRLWEPRGQEYWPIHGSQLFEMALEREPVTLRINPNGDVGGELYAHELEALVRAVASFRRRHR
ncbi:SseB family protein [Enhygromyxa salina]|uniref:SseB family protein n=1 Tax=Enhygromyxa salina TaxID=215803 RepID=UPI0011B266E6|nr:SseB family protein [Enhygromyxa salina]